MDEKDLLRLFDLTGRVAVITGGTRGIGRAIAEGFAAAGAKVVVASRKADACAEAEQALVDQGAEALGVPTHTGDLDAVANLVERTVERFGALDILVNNAANALQMPLAELTPEGWEKSYGPNLKGPVFLARRPTPISPRASTPPSSTSSPSVRSRGRRGRPCTPAPRTRSSRSPATWRPSGRRRASA